MKPEEFYKKKIVEECKKSLNMIDIKENKEVLEEVIRNTLPTCKMSEYKNYDEEDFDIVYNKSRYFKDSATVDHSFHINGELFVLTDSFIYYPEISNGENVNGVISFESEYIKEQTELFGERICDIQKEKVKIRKAFEKLMYEVKKIQPIEIPKVYEQFENLKRLSA